jgi:hypothetical protein
MYITNWEQEKDSNPRHLAYETKLEPTSSPPCVKLVSKIRQDLNLHFPKGSSFRLNYIFFRSHELIILAAIYTIISTLPYS